jgi:cereblon
MFFYPIVEVPGWKSRSFSCRRCGTQVAEEDDCIQVMDRPVKSAYENPLGLSCEIITFSEAANLIAAGSATEEYTWFEGYAWRPVACLECRMHLGWRYEAVDPGREPPHFFGLLTGAIRESSEKGKD